MPTRTIKQLTVVNRVRKHLGDIDSLADSIKTKGLLQPIGIRPDNTLVCGERRIEACKALGWTNISVHVCRGLGDELTYLEAERDENTCREPLTPSEAEEMQRRLLPLYEKIAQENTQNGRKKGGGDRRSKKRSSPKKTKAKKQDNSKRAKRQAAKNTGYSDSTLRKVAEIKRAAESHPDDKDLKALVDALSQPECKVSKVFKAYRSIQHKQKLAAARRQQSLRKMWAVTASQKTIKCEAVISDPPYGILDEPWEPKKIESFTRSWLTRWNDCGADFIASFWSQRYLFDGKAWFDASLTNYRFQHLLVWHSPNNKSPQSRLGFKQTWEPIFFYRRTDSNKQVKVQAESWGDGLTDFDCHVAAVPQETFNDANKKMHPAQKPVSVMEWLVACLTSPNDLVCDPFCGSGTTGIATVNLGRKFYGIESDAKYRTLAKQRITTYAG